MSDFDRLRGMTCMCHAMPREQKCWRCRGLGVRADAPAYCDERRKLIARYFESHRFTFGFDAERYADAAMRVQTVTDLSAKTPKPPAQTTLNKAVWYCDIETDRRTSATQRISRTRKLRDVWRDAKENRPHKHKPAGIWKRKENTRKR